MNAPATAPVAPTVRTVKFLDAPEFGYQLVMQPQSRSWQWSVRPIFTANGASYYGRTDTEEHAEEDALTRIEQQVLALLDARRPDYTFRSPLYEGQCIANVNHVYLDYLIRAQPGDDPRVVAAKAELNRRAGFPEHLNT